MFQFAYSEPLNNGNIGDEHFTKVVPSREVEMYGQCISRGVNSVEVVHYWRSHCIILCVLELSAGCHDIVIIL